MIVTVVLEVMTPDGAVTLLRAGRNDATIDREDDFEGNMARSATKLLDLMDDAAESMRMQIADMRAAAAALGRAEAPNRREEPPWPGHRGPRRRP